MQRSRSRRARRNDPPLRACPSRSRTARARRRPSTRGTAVLKAGTFGAEVGGGVREQRQPGAEQKDRRRERRDGRDGETPEHLARRIARARTAGWCGGCRAEWMSDPIVFQTLVVCACRGQTGGLIMPGCRPTCGNHGSRGRRRLGPFVLERRIAVGGTAEVYLAHPKVGIAPAPHLVVKRLLPTPGEALALRAPRARSGSPPPREAPERGHRVTARAR